MPEFLRSLGLAHEHVVYEELLAEPAAGARRCLDRMGLPMADGVTRPEHNPRSVLTLSHAQVRQPINDRSIGRWRNYAWAFDDRWECAPTTTTLDCRSPLTS